MAAFSRLYERVQSQMEGCYYFFSVKCQMDFAVYFRKPLDISVRKEGMQIRGLQLNLNYGSDYARP